MEGSRQVAREFPCEKVVGCHNNVIIRGILYGVPF